MTLTYRRDLDRPLLTTEMDGNWDHFVGLLATLNSDLSGKASSTDPRFGVAISLGPNIDFGVFSTDGAGVATLDNTSVTFAKLQNVPTMTVAGRVTGSDGPMTALTPTQLRTLLELTSQGATYKTALEALDEASQSTFTKNMNGAAWQTGTTHASGNIVIEGTEANEITSQAMTPATVATGFDLLKGTSTTVTLYADSFGDAMNAKALGSNTISIDLNDDGAGLNYKRTITGNATIEISAIAAELLDAQVVRLIFTSSGSAHTLTFNDSSNVAWKDAGGITRPSAMPSSSGDSLVVLIALHTGSPKSRAVIVHSYTMAA